VTRPARPPAGILGRTIRGLVRALAPRTAFPVSNEEAFAEACRTPPGELREGKALLAITLSLDEITPSLSACVRQARGGDDRCASHPVRVAHGGEGFCAVACCHHEGAALRPGELIRWVPVRHDRTNALLLGREEAGWIGVATARLRPAPRPGGGLEVVAELGRPPPPDPSRSPAEPRRGPPSPGR